MKFIKTLLNCPVCNKKHQKGDVNIVNENNKMALIHISCQNCRNSSLNLFSKQGDQKIMSMGVLTDLNFEEVCKITKSKPINADEVLEVYKNLQ